MNPILSNLERQYGLPPGVLEALWAQESGRGENMLNPQTGAAGHFQLIPANYKAAGIDPNDFGQSARWTAEYAAQAVQRFPGLDPVEAIAAHHYGGPDTKQWGPNTRKYVQEIRGRLAPDVRLASSDPMAQAPTGDPLSGRMDMPQTPQTPQGMLPPQFLATASQGMPSPYGSLALGLGAMGDLFQLPPYRTGALQALMNLQDPAVQQEMLDKRRRTDMWNQQLELEALRTLGLNPMDPFQQAQAQNWRDTAANRARELALEETKQNTPPQGEPEPYAIYDSAGRYVQPYEHTPGTPWPEIPPGGALVPISKATPPEAGGGANDTSKYAAQLEGLASLVTELEQTPAMQNALGTSGTIGAPVSAIAGLFDQVFGTKVNEKFKTLFGGEDPAVIQGRLRGVVLPVARLLVEPTGPLSNNEQNQSRLLLGVMEKGGILSADQAFTLLKLTNKAVRKSAGLPVEEEGSTPPILSAPDSTTQGVQEIRTEDGRTFRVYQ